MADQPGPPQFQRALNLTDQEIAKLLRDTARETARLARQMESQGDRVRAAQLRAAIVGMRAEQQRLWSQVDVITRRGIGRSRGAAERHISSLASRIDGRRSSALVSEAERLAGDGVRRLVASEGARVNRQLSLAVHRNQALANGRIERMIRAAIARGDSPEQLAKDLEQFILPTTPGGVSYAALRLARNEMAEAFRASQLASASRVPWVTDFEWHVTRGQHGKPDICDELDGEVFPKDRVPKRPHVGCYCYLTPVTDAQSAQLAA